MEFSTDGQNHSDHLVGLIYIICTHFLTFTPDSE